MASGTEIEVLSVRLEADYSRLVQQTKEGVDKAERELDKLSEPPKKAQTAWQGFATFMRTNFVAAMAVVTAAFGAALVVMNKLKDAAIEGEKAFFNLAASVAAANREFDTGDLEHWRKTLKQMGDEVKTFSDTELAAAGSRLLDMSKRLGLTSQEMEQVLRRSADLAAGKFDLTEAIERTTSALRGEAESAEALGLTLNEGTIKAYAESLGLVWEELDDVGKAQLRYKVFLEQTEPVVGRAIAYAETAAGKQEALNAQMENSQRILGTQLLPLWEGYAEALGLIANESEESAGIITKFFAVISAWLVTTGAALATWFNMWAGGFDIIRDGVKAILSGENPFDAMSKSIEENQGRLLGYLEHLKNLPATFRDAYNQSLEGFQSGRGKAEEVAGTLGSGGGAGGQGPVLPGVDTEAAQEAFQRYSIELLELQKELAQKQEELAREHAEAETEIIMEHGKDVARLEKEIAKEREEIARDTAKALTQLAEDTADARADAIASAQEDLASLEGETRDEVAKVQEEAREEERRETEDHQREMARLQQQYLLSLEDAVTNRDARAIVNLRRKHAQEVRERNEDFQVQQGRNREAAEDRVKEARETEAKRKREIEKALAKQLEDIKKNEAEKKAEIEASQEEQLAQLKEKEAEKKAALDESLAEQLARENEHYAEQKAALDEAMGQRMEAIGEELAAEEGLESEHAQKILELLGERYGNELAALEAFNERKRAILEAQKQWERAQMAQSTQGFGPTAPMGQGGTLSEDQGGAGIPSFQTGGIVPGRPGQKRLIIAHAGEIILPLNESARLMEQQGHMMASNMSGGEMTVTIKHTGSAPPGVGGSEVEAISATLVDALQRAGIKARRQ